MAQCWNIPPTKKYPKAIVIVSDERGLVALDDSSDGYHSITHEELLRLTMFRIWLYGQRGH